VNEGTAEKSRARLTIILRDAVMAAGILPSPAFRFFKR
jgi:hypothetical protein